MYFSYIQLAKTVGMHPAYFSMYLIFCLTILFTEKYSSKRQEIIHLLLTLLISAFTAMLATRAAIIAFVVSAIFLVIGKIRNRQSVASLSIFIVAASIGFLVVFNPVARFRVIEEPMRTNYVANTSVTEWNSVSYRLVEWQGSWSVINDHMIFGVGTSGWKVALLDFYSNYNSSVAGQMLNSHNQFLQVWMENGILTLFVILFCIFGFVFRPPINQKYVAFILIFSIMCITESILERQKGIVFFTMFQTLFLVSANKSK
jgi:O-antigen ligase